MIASALVAPCLLHALCALQAVTPTASPWAEPSAQTLAASLALEGPLDNDTDDARNRDAITAIAAGDASYRAQLAQPSESARVEAFEAWRRALQASAPLDAVAIDRVEDILPGLDAIAFEPRRAVSVGAAVRARVELLGSAAFRARFEGAAQLALAAAHGDDAALERVEHEHPFTRAAVLATLQRFDLALERGALFGARAALERTRLWPITESDLQAAIARRSASLPARDAALPAKREPAFTRLRVERVLNLGLDPGPNQRLRPSAAFGADERVWIQDAEQMFEVDPLAAPRAFELRDLLAPLPATWLASFGDKERPWLQRPALEAACLALVAGRAREDQGNALCVFDVSGKDPHALWVYSAAGFAHASGERAENAAVLLDGRLEFQPGPLVVDGLVIAQILQDEPPSQISDWLVAFEAESGRVAWKRCLARGADRRVRAASRFSEPRTVTCSCLPLARAGDAVVAATELGIVARASLHDGVLNDAFRLARAAFDADVRVGSGGPFAFEDGSRSDGSAFAPLDSGDIAYVLGAGSGPHAPLRIPGLVELLGASRGSATALVDSNGRIALARLDLASGARVEALPFPRAMKWKGGVATEANVVCAAGSRVWLFDPAAEFELRATAELDGLDAEANAGVLVHGSRAYVIGARRAWVIALE